MIIHSWYAKWTRNFGIKITDGLSSWQHFHYLIFNFVIYRHTKCRYLPNVTKILLSLLFLLDVKRGCFNITRGSNDSERPTEGALNQRKDV